MWKSDDWKDYELLDTSDGERLERWKNIILIRPDPQIIWHGTQSSGLEKLFCTLSPCVIWRRTLGI